MAIELTQLLQSHLRTGSLGHLEEFQRRLNNDPSAVHTLIDVIRVSVSDSNLLLAVLDLFDRFGHSLPDEESFSFFFSLLKSNNSKLIVHISNIIARTFQSTVDLFATLEHMPFDSGSISCLLHSVILHKDDEPHYHGLFIDALCEWTIPVDQREEYARFLSPEDEDEDEDENENENETEEGSKSERPRDWEPVRRFLPLFYMTGPDIWDSIRLLGVLLAPRGCFAPPDLCKPLLSLLQLFVAVYYDADQQEKRPMVSNALNRILRVCELNAEDWERSEIIVIFEACWKLLNPNAKICESIDDFFCYFLDPENDTGLNFSCGDADLQSPICILMTNSRMLNELAQERICSMEVLDIPALRILTFWGMDSTLVQQKFMVSSQDLLWVFFACQYLQAHPCDFSIDFFARMSTDCRWPVLMLGLGLLRDMPIERLPCPELLAGLVAASLQLMDGFTTGWVTDYVKMIDVVVTPFLKVEAVRSVFAPHVPEWIDFALQHIERSDHMLTAAISHLICRFIIYREFMSSIKEMIFDQSSALLKQDWRRGVTFLSEFVLKVGDFLPLDGNEALGNALQNAISCNDWEEDVCDVAFYFVMVHEMGDLVGFCLLQMEDEFPRHLMGLLVAVLWTTKDQEIQDCLINGVSRAFGEESVGMLTVIVAMLYLGGRPFNDTYMLTAARLGSNTIAQNFDPFSLDDRIVLAFLYRFLTVNRRLTKVPFWQSIYRSTIVVLRKPQPSTEFEPSSLLSMFLKHKRFFVSHFPWIRSDWQSYVAHVTRFNS
jgi:hypothetical protein